MSNATETVDSSELELNAIMEMLDGPPDVLPEEAFEAARLHKEKIIPRLIASIERATQEVKAGREALGNQHFFALFLLTEFRAKEALPAIIAAISLPGEGASDLFGGAITESLRQILAVLAWDKVSEVVVPLIRNREVYHYVRRGAADSLAAMVAAGLREREDMVNVLRERLRETMDNRDHELATGLVCTLCDLYPEEAYEEIKEAFARGLVDEMMINLRSVNRKLKHGRDDVLRRLCEEPVFIPDAAAELRDWACFQPLEDEELEELEEQQLEELSAPWPPSIPQSRPKPLAQAWPSAPVTPRVGQRVGRNDPCPCGSGKKFKKCCGFAGRRADEAAI